MKRIYTLIMAGAAVLAASCAKENARSGNEGGKTVEYVDLQLSSLLEGQTSQSTKTSVNPDPDNGSVSWSEGNQISVFDNSETAKSNNNCFTFEGESKFSGKVPEDATEFYALYPYSENASFSDGAISTTLPADQIAAAGTFADNVAVMAGKVDGSVIKFKNICSHIGFTIAEDITDVQSITLMGNGSEALCGTFSVTFTDDEPAVTVSNPETYVRLHNEDSTALAAGTYYFTILPVEFAKGFTVILTKTDGSQKAKSISTAVASVGARNKILPLKELTADQYEEHLNYFVRYNEGFDITVGGYTFNKTTKSGGVLVNDTKGNGNINSDGVYFVDPSATTANFNKAQAYKSLIVLGSDDSQRSNFTFTQPTRPYDGGDILLLSNLRCTVTATKAFEQNKDTEGHNFSKFGNVVFSNCHFKNISGNFMQFNQNAFTELDLNVEDCEFGIKAATVYIFNTGSQASQAQSIIFKNNIFYAESETAATAVKLIHSDKLVIDAFNGDANTFNNVIPDGNLLRIGDIVTSFDFARNLFIECNKTAKSTSKLITFKINKQVLSATGTVTNNYYYNSASEAVIGPGIGNSVYKDWTINSVAELTDSPLSANWNPAKESYGAYTYPSSVSKTVGAKRADMTATSTASVNSTSYTNAQ